jgi:hypothetical protein
MWSRLGNFKLLEMGGSHEVMFTRTEELADKIIEARSKLRLIVGRKPCGRP